MQIKWGREGIELIANEATLYSIIKFRLAMYKCIKHFASLELYKNYFYIHIFFYKYFYYIFIIKFLCSTV